MRQRAGLLARVCLTTNIEPCPIRDHGLAARARGALAFGALSRWNLAKLSLAPTLRSHGMSRTAQNKQPASVPARISSLNLPNAGIS